MKTAWVGDEEAYFIMHEVIQDDDGAPIKAQRLHRFGGRNSLGQTSFFEPKGLEISYSRRQWIETSSGELLE